MAKQPRSLTGKVAVVTGGGRGIGKAISRSLAREGVRVAIADLDAAVAEAAAAETGAGAIGLALDVTDRPAFTAALDRDRAAARPDRHPRQQRRDHADRPVRGGDGRDRDPPARAQPPRRHPRLQGGRPAHEAARHRPHRQRRLDRGQVRRSRRRHLLRLQARRRRPLRVAARRAPRHRRRGPRRDAGVRQHRADRGHQRAQGRQAPEPRGRRRGRRRGAPVRALRGLRAEVAGRPRPLVRADAALVLRVARPQDGRRGAAGRRQGRPRGLRGSAPRRARPPPRRSWPRPRGRRAEDARRAA